MLHHVRTGSGPALLLAHGIGMSHHAFDGVVEDLAADFEVLAVDLPGFGGSAPLIEPPTLPRLAAACGAFMAAQGHDRFLVAGNSLGGAIALHLALAGRVDAACALSPVGFAEGWELAYLRGYVRSTPALLPLVAPLLKSAHARRLLFSTVAAHGDRMSPAAAAHAVEDVQAPGLAATATWALGWQAPTADTLPCPVTIAWGEADRLLLFKPQSARARQRLPTARHETLPGIGHLPGWDDPATTARTIRAAVTG